MVQITILCKLSDTCKYISAVFLTMILQAPRTPLHTEGPAKEDNKRSPKYKHKQTNTNLLLTAVQLHNIQC